MTPFVAERTRVDELVRRWALSVDEPALPTSDLERWRELEADNLRKHVTDVIKDKNLDVGFASASEVCRNREGDCTEHSVLLAAMARARGLPARAAFGMVAVPGSFSQGTIRFGYHMWTQIYVNGRWLDFDAALDQPRPDATHIVLGFNDLTDASIPLNSINTFMRVAGRTQLTVEPLPVPTGQ